MDYSPLKMVRLRQPQEGGIENFEGSIEYRDFSQIENPSTVLITPKSFLHGTIPGNSSFNFMNSGAFFLIYSCEGRAAIEHDGMSFVLKPGCGCFLNASKQTRVTTDFSGWEFTILFLSGQLAQTLHDIYRSNVCVFHDYQFPDFELRQFSVINSAVRPDVPFYEVSCHFDHLLCKLISLAKPHRQQEASEKYRSMMSIITYMHEHYDEPLTIEELAERCFLSESQFRKSFQSHTHTSPKKYLSELRLKAAEELLRTTDVSIDQICAKCGFSSPSYFIQVFKQAYQTTPLQYRKNR